MRAEHGDSERLWKAAPRLIGLGRGLLDLVLPPRAFDGGSALTGGLSAAAWSRITFLDDPVCDGCGLALPFDSGAVEHCPACQARPKAFGRARAACVYDEHSRDLILKLKHADRTDLSGLFARWLSRAAAPLLEEADAIAPVPMHPGRLLRRRYNQAAEIARPLAAISGVAYLPDALIRQRDTVSQGGKSAVGRRRNVAAAFVVPEAKRHRVIGRRIILVDDVLTTGATLQAACLALQAAGVQEVAVVAVARTPNS